MVVGGGCAARMWTPSCESSPASRARPREGAKVRMPHATSGPAGIRTGVAWGLPSKQGCVKTTGAPHSKRPCQLRASWWKSALRVNASWDSTIAMLPWWCCETSLNVLLFMNGCASANTGFHNRSARVSQTSAWIGKKLLIKRKQVHESLVLAMLQPSKRCDTAKVLNNTCTMALFNSGVCDGDLVRT